MMGATGMSTNPQVILNLLLSIQTQIKQYQPSGETAGTVRIFYAESSDILDRIAENINLANILETGAFLLPTAEFGQ